MLKRKEYPKNILIGDSIYRIKFVRKFKEPDVLGECDPSDLEIRIKCGLGIEETFKTFLHECLHAILEFESEDKIKPTHKQIYVMEELFYTFLRDNMFSQFRGR